MAIITFDDLIQKNDKKEKVMTGQAVVRRKLVDRKDEEVTVRYY